MTPYRITSIRWFAGVAAFVCAGTVVAAGGQTLAGPVRVPPTITVQPRARIVAALDVTRRVTLRGTIPTAIRGAVDGGRIADSTPLAHMKLVITRSAEQESALQGLLAEQQDSSSPNYHQWMTPEEFAAHFGPAQADVRTITSWLESQGFSVDGLARGGQTVDFSGNAGQVRAAFQTEMHRYTVDGEEHIANAQEMSLPAALAPVAAGVASLNDFRPQPMLKLAALAKVTGVAAESNQPVPLINFGANVYDFSPPDYKAMYNVPSNLTGSGIRIGVPEPTEPTGGLTGSSGSYGNADYDQFSSVFGLPGGNLSVVIVGTDPGDVTTGVGTQATNDVEASLDIQWSHAIAPGAQIVLTIAGNTSVGSGIDLAQDYLVDNGAADVITVSYGVYRTDTAYVQYIEQRGEQAAAEGISYIVGSGDWGSGSSDGIAVAADLFTSHPYVTSVGGTDLDWGVNGVYWWGINQFDLKHTSVGGHIPEDAWTGSGGGSNPLFAKPDWQAGVPGIPNDGYRDFPDVSLTGGSHAPYLICLDGGCALSDPAFAGAFGTSASGPAFAGMVALLDQSYGGRQGLLNRSLYKLGAGESWAGCNGSSQSTVRPPSSCVFYDVTVGSNAVPGQPSYGTGSETYNTGTSYDLVTGLGSVNLSELISQWGSVSYLPTTTAFSLPEASSSFGDPLAFSGSVSSSSGGTPTGFVTLVDSTQSFGSYALDAGGNFSGTVQGLAIGTESVTAKYGGDAKYGVSTSAAQSTQVNKIGSVVSVAWDPATNTGFGSTSHSVIVTVEGANGYGVPTGQVHLYYMLPGSGTLHDEGTFPLGSGSSANQAQTQIGAFLPVNAPPGTYTFLADYLGDGTFNPSTVRGSATVTVTTATSTVSLGTSTNSVTAGSSVTLTASLSVPENTIAPTGTVQFYQNGVAIGSAVALSGVAVSGSNYVASAALETTGLLPGSDAVTAVYSGDGNVAGANSNLQSIVIAGFSTTVSLAADRTSGIIQESTVKLTANIFTLKPIPPVSGTVQFYANGVSLGIATVVSGVNGSAQEGTATLQTSALAAGVNTVTAIYSGDAHYNPGASFAVSITITSTYLSSVVTPSTLVFPQTSVGSSSAAQSINFSNNGTGTISIGTVSISGPGASSFSVSSDTCSQLLPVTACFLNVIFTPQSSGALTATLTINDNSLGGPHTVALTGNALPQGPFASLSALTLSFGNETVGTVSAPKTVTLTNIGNATMNGIVFQFVNGSFVPGGNTCTGELSAGASCSLSMTFQPQSAAVQAGEIEEYDSSHSGSINVNMSGTGTAVQAVTLDYTLHTLLASLTTPYGIAGDSKGNVYVSDSANNAVYKIDQQGFQTTLPIAGLVAPAGLTMDSSGNLYVVSNGGSHLVSVIRYTSPASQLSFLFSQADGGAGVAVDTSGNVYLADPGTSSVWERGPSDSSATQIGLASLGVGSATGIAIDASNNLYVAGSGGPVVEKANLTGTPTTLTTLNSPVALAIGPDGSLYIADAGTSTVSRYAGGTTSTVLKSGGISALRGVYVDGSAEIYAVSQGTATIYKSSATATIESGAAAVGSSETFGVTMNVPTGNSVTAVSLTDIAGDAEWTLPLGNLCVPATGTCSLLVDFAPAYPGLREATLKVTDSLGNVLTYPMYGIGQGPEAMLLPGTMTTISGTWVPGVLHSDNAGNVYVLDSTSPAQAKVQMITPAGAVSTVLSGNSNLSGLTDMAVDGQGAYYLLDNAGVQKVVNGTYSTLIGGSGNSIALDQQGDLYVSISNFLQESNAGLASLGSYFANGSISAMATDATGDLYFATQEPAIYEMAKGGAVTQLFNGSQYAGNYELNDPTGLAVDAAGAVYVADAGEDALFRIDPQGNATAFGLSFQSPAGIGVTVTPQGAIYLSDDADKAVYKMSPAASSLAFGNIADKAASPAQSVLMVNAGNAPLTISGVSTPAAYLQQQDAAWCVSSASLGAGANCDVTLVFSPATLGAQNGSATLTDNSLNVSSAQTISLTGSSIIGAEMQLNFTQAPPLSINAQGNLGLVSVEVDDAAGNRVTAATDGLTLTISGPAGFTPITVNATLSRGVASFDLSSIALPLAGAYSTTAATTVSSSVSATDAALTTVLILTQTISFSSLSGQTYGVATMTLGATASSGLAVSYTVSGPATISGSSLSVVGVGTVMVTAQQAGNGTYSAATSVSQSFTVSAATLTVTPNNTVKSFGTLNPPLTYVITGYVNNDAVSSPMVSGSPAITTTATTLSTAGNYPISAALGTLATPNYVFQFGSGTLTVTGGAAQSIDFDPLPNLPVRAASYRLTAFASSGLPVSYTVSGPASLSGAQLTVTGAGAVTVTASQVGNGSFAAAATVKRSFTAQ